MLKRFILFQIIFLVVIIGVSSQVKGQTTDDQTQADNEKVYKKSEVDEQAQVTKKSWVSGITKCEGSGRAVLQLVLHKSGKITKVEIIKPSPCKYFDKKAIKAVEKIKFKPAIKDGKKVSQKYRIQYSYQIN